MYLEAYELLREIVQDNDLNEYVKKSTGKRLVLIDSGPQVTLPAAAIMFKGGEIHRPDNDMQNASYTLAFALPYWGHNGMEQCHKFLDVAIEAIFAHSRLKQEQGGRKHFVIRASPELMEDDPEGKWWTVTIDVVVSIF